MAVDERVLSAAWCVSSGSHTRHSQHSVLGSRRRIRPCKSEALRSTKRRDRSLSSRSPDLTCPLPRSAVSFCSPSLLSDAGMRGVLGYLDCRRSRPPTPRHAPTAAAAATAAADCSAAPMDRAARERQQRLDDRERERRRREQLQHEEDGDDDDDSDSDVVELSPPPAQPARVVHTHQHQHHHHHHHTIALQPPPSIAATKAAAQRWAKAGARNGLHAAATHKRRRTRTAWGDGQAKEAGREDEEDEYVPSGKEEKAVQRKAKAKPAIGIIPAVRQPAKQSRQSSILQHLTTHTRSPISSKQRQRPTVKEEKKMRVEQDEEEDEEEEGEEDEEQEDEDDDEEYVQESEEEDGEEDEAEEDDVRETALPVAPVAHSIKGRASPRVLPRRSIIKDEDDEDDSKERRPSKPASQRNSPTSASHHTLKQHSTPTSASPYTQSHSSSSDFLSPFAPLPPPLPPSPPPPPYPANRLPASLAVRVGWRGDEGREADAWVEKVRKVVYSSPSQIRIRYVLRAAARTQPAVVGAARLSPVVQHAMSVLVSHLLSHTSAAPFIQPVNPYALLIPDYFNIIHHPLSLTTVHARLTASPPYYASPLQLLADVRHTLEAAWLYNECDSDVSERARQLWGWVGAVVGGGAGGEVGRCGREIGRWKGVDVAMREWNDRSVVQCVWFCLPRVDVHVAVSAEQLPQAVVRRLGRRMGRVPAEWSSDWLQNATSE